MERSKTNGHYVGLSTNGGEQCGLADSRVSLVRRGRFQALLSFAFWLLLVGALQVSVAEDWVYTARPGDNLWNLSKVYLKDVSYYRRLQRYNGIDAPRVIPPGTPIRMPIAWLRHAPAEVEVLRARGAVEVVRAGATQAQPLRPGDRLAIGDQMRTGPESNATIGFADGSRLVLQAGSELLLDTLTAYGKTGMVDTRLRLRHGRIDTQVQPARGPASRYEIKTPAAVTAVRGTNFRVSAEQDRPVARSESIDGEVDVSGAEVVRVLPAGFGTVAEAGKPPLPPKPLLPAPDVSKLPARLLRFPTSIHWPAVTGAVAYRIQIAPDQAFETLLVDTRNEPAQYQLTELPNGEYVLRVRAIDELGLEGLNADAELTVAAHPFPPRMLQPENEGITRDPRPELRWSGAAPTRGYRLQLARDAAFRDLVLEETVRGTSTYLPAEDLPPGEYHWRMASRDPTGAEGPFSLPRRFFVRAPLPRPVLAAPRIHRNHVSFAWQPGAPVKECRFEISRDAEFGEGVQQYVAVLPHMSLSRLPPGRHYYRVRCLDTDGYRGPYSATQELQVPRILHWQPFLLFIVPFLL